MATVVFAIDSLRGGGAEKVVLTLAAAFAARGHRCHLLTFQPRVDYARPAGVELHFIDFSRHRRRRHWRFTACAKEVDDLLRVIERRDGAIAGVLSNLTLTDRIFHHSRFPRVVYCIHNHLSQYWEISGNWLRRYIRLRKLRSLYNGKHLVCVSEGVEADLYAVGVVPRSARTIYNPFDVDTIRAMAEQPVDLPFAGDYVICVASFKEQKRHDRLIRVFAKAKVPVKLLLLGQGSGPQEEALRAEARTAGVEGQVIFHRFTPNPYPYIRQAKALLLTSDYEGLPTVLVEALICRTPVVSTDCPSGPREILKGDQARFLVPVTDEELFAQKIREVLHSPPDLAQSDLTRFTKDQVVARYEKLILSLA